MNGFVDPVLMDRAMMVAKGHYPTPSLVPHRLLNLREAQYAAEALVRKLWKEYGMRSLVAKQRLDAYIADCYDVLTECQEGRK